MIIIIVLLISLLFIIICELQYQSNEQYFFNYLHTNLLKSKPIIVKNNDYILLHFKNIINDGNKIYKIYKI